MSNLKRGAVVVLAILTWFLPATAHATETWVLPLTVEQADGCARRGRTYTLPNALPTADEAGRITLDAKQPTAACATTKAPRADGLLQRSYLRYDLLVPQAGTYAIWARLACDPGRARFVELLGGQRLGAHFEEAGDDARPLHWVRRLDVKLPQGLCHFAVAAFGYAMPAFDKLVLTPDRQTELNGDGPAPVTAAATAATIETADLQLPGLLQLQSLQGQVNQPVSLSTDGGQTWAAYHDGATLDGRFRLRFSLTTEHPELTLPNVEVAAREGAVLALRDKSTELLLSGVTGSLWLARDLATGRHYVGGQAPAPPAAIDFKQSGEAVWTRVDGTSATRLVPPDRPVGWAQKTVEAKPLPVAPRVTLTDGGVTTVREYTLEGLGRARVTERVEPLPDGTWRFAAHVDNLAGPADVVAVTYPSLPQVELGDSGLDDTQLRLQSFGHETIQPGRQPIRDEAYCGGVVLNWTQVFDDEASLYLGAHDPQGLTTLHGSVDSGQEGESVGLWMRRLDEVQPGRQADWETRVAFGPGGWHHGAKVYANWFTGTHGPAHYPDWLRTADGWIDLQLENYPGLTFTDLPDQLTGARSSGLDWVQVWGQFGYPWGPCCCAWYGPSPAYGGSAAWAAAAKSIKARGGHLGGYFIYDRVDRLPTQLGSYLGRFTADQYGKDEPFDSAELQWRLQLVDNPANLPVPRDATEEQKQSWLAEIAAHQKLQAEGQRAAPVMWWQQCYLPDPAFRDWLCGWVIDRYVKLWGSNTCYIDVMGTGGAKLSYDPRRGLNGDGLWGEGRRLLAEALRVRGQKLDPSFAVTQEGLGDLPGLNAAAMCSGVYRGGRNVYRYSFPDRVLIHGLANSGSGGSSMDRYLITFLEAMRYDVVGRADALATALLQLDRQLTPALWQATFVDTDGVTSSDPRVGVRRLKSNTPELPGSFLTVTNRDYLRQATLTLDEDLCGAIGSAYAIDLEGQAQQLELPRAGRQVTLTVPHSLASLVYLAPGETDAPLHAVVRLKRDGRPAVQVTLLNPSKDPRQGTCELTVLGLTEPFDRQRAEAEALLPLAETRLPYDVPGRRAQLLQFAVRSLTDFDWTVRLRVKLSPTRGRATQRELLLTPLVLNGTFEHLDATQGELHLPPSDTGFQHRLIDLDLLPNHRYRVTFRSKRSGFTARVRGSLLRLWKDSPGYQDARYSLDTKRPNEWQTIGGELTTPPDLCRAGLYLYNVDSPDDAWFDDIQAEDLGPAPLPE